GARALEELAEQGHKLPQVILDWRQVSKLRSTYTEALPAYVNPKTHRVHTSRTCRISRSVPRMAARFVVLSLPLQARNSCRLTIRRSSFGYCPKWPTCRPCVRLSRTASTFTQ